MANGNLDHLRGTTASEAFDQADALKARVAELEAQLRALVSAAEEACDESRNFPTDLSSRGANMRYFDTFTFLSQSVERAERTLKGKELNDEGR